MLRCILPLVLLDVVSSTSTAGRLLRRDSLSIDIETRWHSADIFSAILGQPLSGSSDAAWDEVVSWLQAGGATVSASIKSNVTQHGGFAVRGVVADQSMEKSETLLSIPKSLWLHMDNFQFDGMEHLSCGDYVKHAVAIAIEDRKGSDSKYYAYLKNLPSLDNYQSFYIEFASSETLKEFEGLPIVDEVRASQAEDENRKACFQAWQHHHGSDGLEWNNVLLGLARWRTRSYGIDSTDTDRSTALIPASDLLNTARGSLLNTDWTVKDSSAALLSNPSERSTSYFFKNSSRGRSDSKIFEVTTSKKIEAGEELYDSYCPSCDNSGFLRNWGIYMEDNPTTRRTDPRHMEDTSRANKISALKRVALPMLQDSSHGLTAPRCTPAVLQQIQGPIKCALARLAWEQLADAWGVRDSKSFLAADDDDEEKSFETRQESSGRYLVFNARGMVQTQNFKARS